MFALVLAPFEPLGSAHSSIVSCPLIPYCQVFHQTYTPVPGKILSLLLSISFFVTIKTMSGEKNCKYFF